MELPVQGGWVRLWFVVTAIAVWTFMGIIIGLSIEGSEPDADAPTVCMDATSAGHSALALQSTGVGREWDDWSDWELSADAITHYQELADECDREVAEMRRDD